LDLVGQVIGDVDFERQELVAEDLQTRGDCHALCTRLDDLPESEDERSDLRIMYRRTTPGNRSYCIPRLQWKK
jgi:hypothetical protein